MRAQGLIALLTFTLLAPSPAFADAIKIGVVRVIGSGPVFLAKEKGYFDAEGLSAEIVFFDSSQNVAVATVAGDIDFDLAGLVAAAYTMAGQGALKMIAGGTREMPGYQGNSYLASNRAYAAGLRTLKDLPGHSFAVATMGSPGHYNIAQLFEKYHYDMKSLRLVAMQGLPNALSALVGGNVDAANLPSNLGLPAVERGEAKLLGSVAEETPWQLAAVFVATRTADERRDTVERFLRAYRKGARGFHDAYTGPDDKPRNGETAPDVTAIVSKYTGQPVSSFRPAYMDADARLDVQDVLHQIAWYKSQGMVKPDTDGDRIIDRRYVVALPGK
jgi:NitT/TauT family transport system substrate-binding protein